MSWGLITQEWRLKLLAIGLAVLMLGVVAFATYQPTTRSLTVGLNYVVTSPNIILMNPPAKTNVTYSGLADVIQNVNTSNLLATVDTTGAGPGTAVKLNVTARSLLGSQVSVQNPPPIAVNIDTRQIVQIPVQVNARAATGWNLDPTKTLATCPGAKDSNPCQVQFDGPVSWEAGLKAAATVPGPVVGTNDLLNQPVQLQPSGNVDLTQRTVPVVHVDVTSVDIHIEAVAGATTASVPLLDASPSHAPPQGYRVTGVTITPQFVNITGDPAVLVRVHNIVLPAVDLSRSTSDATFTVPINYPSGVIGDLQVATVKYSISANPNVSPSPGPT